MGTQSKVVALSDYHIIKTLGSGATGKVKLARHPHTDQLVALKIISKDLLLRQRNLYEKVRREIAVMKLLAGSCLAVERSRHRAASLLPEPVPDAHIGVMKLLDVYDTEHSFVLVLEYCDGGELFDLLVECGYLPEHLVLDLFQQLVYALEFCHERGICHRDLKPENVLLMSDGRIKLADFGMSSLLTPNCLLQTACGSPHYCAPEVLRNEAYEGRPADIWSLGVVLYAMTTGGLPFDDDNLHRLITKVSSGAFYMPEPVPDNLATVIQSMLTVDPKKRATLEDIKSSDWFRSRPCRSDIYKGGVHGDVQHAHMADDRPVESPKKEIVNYLRDLGMGDRATIRLRLTGRERCVERDFYYQLLNLCGESLCFQSGQDIPSSPKTEATDCAVQLRDDSGNGVNEPSVFGEGADVEKRAEESFEVAGVERPDSEALTGVARARRVPTVVKVLQLESATGSANVNALRNVTSI